MKTPGRGDDAEPDKLYTKADYKASKNIDERDRKAAAFLEALGGKNNIVIGVYSGDKLITKVKTTFFGPMK